MPSPLRPTRPSHAQVLRRALPVLAAALLAGCGSTPRPVQPVEPVPPAVVATEPAARAAGVLYDTPISVDFAEPLDPATLTTSNVFLKLDTQRVPILLSWDGAARRLRVHPQALLQLRRTYTVELSAGVRTAEGVALGSHGWFFQFTTNSTRRPTRPRPQPGDANESPFAMLSWDSTEVGVGAISYQLWAGTDSAAIAVRAGSPTATTGAARWLPTQRWPLGSSIYWAITVVNAATGERHDGPVRSFRTLPLGLPLDSVLVRGQDYGFNYIIAGVSNIHPYQFCSSDSVVSTGGTQGWMTFPLTALPAGARVAEARLEVYTFPHYVSRLATTTMTLWSSKIGWPLPCRPTAQLRELLPVQDQAVATGRQESDRRIIYMSDLLASHVEATARRGGFFGYEFVSTSRLAYATPRLTDASFHPYLKIHYFRTPPRPELSNLP